MTVTFAVYLAPADAANVAINSADKRTAPLVEIAGRITVDGVTAEDAMRIADAWHDVHHELARRERVAEAQRATHCGRCGLTNAAAGKIACFAPECPSGLHRFAPVTA